MTYKSKKSIMNTLAGVILATVYIFIARGKWAPEANDIKAWAAFMLIFIGIGIVSAIIIQILFHIGYSIGIAVKEEGAEVGVHPKDDKESDERVARIIKSTMLEDEMDKTIELRAAHVGYTITGCGFILMLVALTLGKSPLFILHIPFASILIASIIEGAVSIYFYERGV